MNGPCPQMRNQIADYLLGALDAEQAGALQEHLAGCEACRRYAQDLEDQAKSLVAFGQQIETDMEARQNRVIAALQDVSPTEADITRIFPFLGGFLKTAVAAVLVLGVGVAVGRWTAPRPVDIERLRTEVQASVAASLKSAVQEAVLAQMDQRLQAGLATHEANLRAELGEQLRGDWRLFATQFTSGLERQMDKRFAEFVQLVEEARLKDRQRVAKALEQIEQNRIRDKTQIGMGFQSLAALTAKATPAMQP
jgi:anti-sigma factor RsiW